MPELSSLLSPSSAAALNSAKAPSATSNKPADGMFGMQVNLANYKPNPEQANITNKGDGRLDQFQNLSPIERELKKTVDSTQQMVVTYIKGRVPLGDDKFNATDMFRSILDILKAMENVQMVKMMEDGNRIALNNLFMQMPKQVGNKALVEDDIFDFSGEEVKFAVDIPKEAGVTTISLMDEEGREVQSWVTDEHGLNPMTWDGADDKGKKCVNGCYKVVATYSNVDGSEGSVPVYVTNKIDSVYYDPSVNGGYPEYRGVNNRPMPKILAVYDKQDNEKAMKPVVMREGGTQAVDTEIDAEVAAATTAVV